MAKKESKLLILENAPKNVIIKEPINSCKNNLNINYS